MKEDNKNCQATDSTATTRKHSKTWEAMMRFKGSMTILGIISEGAKNATEIFCIVTGKVYFCEQNIHCMLKDKIDYLVMLIAEFAKRYGLTQRAAYQYIAQFKALELCDRHYGVMHTLPLEDNLESIRKYCRKNGGQL